MITTAGDLFGFAGERATGPVRRRNAGVVERCLELPTYRRWSVYGCSTLPERVRAAASAGRRAQDALAALCTDPAGRQRLIR
jgi:hypothetical protein